jgi:hypothetical protein
VSRTDDGILLGSSRVSTECEQACMSETQVVALELADKTYDRVVFLLILDPPCQCSVLTFNHHDEGVRETYCQNGSCFRKFKVPLARGRLCSS